MRQCEPWARRTPFGTEGPGVHGQIGGAVGLACREGGAAPVASAKALSNLAPALNPSHFPPGREPDTSTRTMSGTPWASRMRTKHAALSAEDESRQPPSAHRVVRHDADGSATETTRAGRHVGRPLGDRLDDAGASPHIAQGPRSRRASRFSPTTERTTLRPGVAMSVSAGRYSALPAAGPR